MASKIGCRSGKTTLIDPNSFQGQDSSSNIPVQLEDMSISIELTTTKKGRTILTSSGTNGGSSDSSSNISVNFFSGSSINGENYLTTKFTDLTTSFDTNNNNESLGITSIDIDFNTSFAPMVTIHFVDIKGSAIFQNEANIKDGTNPYSTFFQLPYPLYKLKVKGYYGKSVEYCLHMTKFTNRFNSQTGNFEITASFIGYTYALLSDMLLGYLKAIPFTDKGAAKYDELQKADDKLLTLVELYKRIQQINSTTKKVLSTDKDYLAISNYTSGLDKLSAIQNNINILGASIDINKTLAKYDYYVLDFNTGIVAASYATFKSNVSAAIDSYLTTTNDIPISKEQFIYLGVGELMYSNTTIEALLLEVKTNPDDKLVKLTEYLTKPSNGYSDMKKAITIYDNTNKYQILSSSSTNTKRPSYKSFEL